MTSAARQDYFGFEVDLESFSGPLDLLLSLIRREEVDIFDIPIARITDQYLAAVESLRERQVEVAGEFLVMAATLMQIKSRMLLPRPPAAEGVEEEEDPRQELVALLLEYQRYREAAETLGSLAELRQRLFEVPGDALEAGPAAVEEASLTALFGAYERLLAEARPPAPPRLRETGYTVREQAELLLARLADGPRRFAELFGERPSRAEVVVTFMALLELVASGRLQACQEQAFGEIVLSRVEHGVNARD